MTKRDDKRVPALRFKGFTDEWEQRKLKEVVNINPSTNVPNTFNYVDLNSVKGVSLIKVKKINKKEAPSRAQRVAKNGDIFYQMVRPYQKNNYLFNKPKTSFPYVFSTGYAQLRSIKTSPSYIFPLLQKSDFVNKVLAHSTGTSYPAINSRDLGQIKIYLPNELVEQNKIGEIFQKINKIIELQQRKLRQLKLLKNALLKRMFTAKKSPTLRFRDFSKDWKLHKLQDITDRLDNARVPVTASKRIAGSTPYYGANGIQDYVKGYTHDGEFLLVAEDGANNINDYPVICAKGKIWVNNHAHVLQAKNKKIDILFLMYALKFLNMKKYLVGGSRSKLNAETMMKLALKLPELDEEHNIGVLIKNMDVLITQYKSRIQKINKFKQFLLQNMFI